VLLWDEEIRLDADFLGVSRPGALDAADNTTRDLPLLADGFRELRAPRFEGGSSLAIFRASARLPARKNFASAFARACLSSATSALDRLNCFRTCWASRFAALRRCLAKRACSRRTFSLDSDVATRIRNIRTSPINRCETIFLCIDQIQ
jgi:hypothetical protein